MTRRALALLPVGFHAVLAIAACGAALPVHPLDDGPDAADAAPAAPEWRPVVEGLDGALLSIWGTSERDVWAVGGPLGNEGFDALVLRFDGSTWRRHRPGEGDARQRSYWWVHGSSAADVWLVGEKGRITHHDGATFTEVPSGTDATLFGVWAAAPDDAWAVGGAPEDPQGDKDVLLHWDGATWKPETLPAATGVSFFKVWGASRDDVYVVGEAGVIWHRRGGAWTREGEGLATARLTTVAGCSATEVFAVGGRDLLVSGGSSWKRVEIDPLTLVNELNGVACDPTTGQVVVVGGGSLKLRRVDGRWVSDFGAPPLSDLHGAWADPAGGLWGVGGQFVAAPRPGTRRAGVIGHFGLAPIPGGIVE
jgi:hypothetical protein